MRLAGAFAALAFLAACAGFERERLVPGVSTLSEVRGAMGAPADELERPDGETWLYYPSQPFGRKVFVARLAPDGRLIALEQRLTDENVARLVPGTTTREEVRALFGPPHEALFFPRLARDTWSWHMRQFGVQPVGLHVQLSPDGVVREVYVLDESKGGDRRDKN